jgi:hypothetical protein
MGERDRMEHPLNEELLPGKVRQATNPLLPNAKKLVVAAGVLPLSPEDNVLALYQLCFDESRDVASKAADTLGKVPPHIVAAAIKRFPWPEPLDYIGKLFKSHTEIVIALLGNKAAGNETVAAIARTCPRDIVEVIAANQQRLMDHPPVIESIYLNRNARMSTVDRVVTFAVRNGIELEGLSSYKEIAASYKLQEKKADAGEARRQVHEEASDASFADAFSSGFDQAQPQPGEGAEGDEFMAFAASDGGVFSEFDGEGEQSAGGVFGEFDEAGGAAAGGDQLFGEFDQALKPKRKEGEEEEDESSLSLEIKISKMSVPHKIRLATIGNSIHRSLLLQDSNRMVALAAIKSPAISEQEVMRCTQSRSVDDEILRYISMNRDWTKSYFVKVNLVNNPKTPMTSAMRFLNYLRKNDLKTVSANKNVPYALRTAAKNILKKKGEA